MKNKINENCVPEIQRTIKTIQSSSNFELVIKKSKFIADAFPLKSLDEAGNLISFVRKKYPDASHHCFAYVFGTQKELYRYNDDGEPSGTAGKPILQTILYFDLTNVMVFVTRYFGGIKLGASGLVRAYAECAKMVLSSAVIIEIPILKEIVFEVDYLYFPKIKSLILEYLQSVEETYYSNFVKVRGMVSEENYLIFKKILLNQTSGKILFK